jgi:hypothetical protein
MMFGISVVKRYLDNKQVAKTGVLPRLAGVTFFNLENFNIGDSLPKPMLGGTTANPPFDQTPS